MKRLFVGLLLGLAACAASGSRNPRSYVRSDQEEIPLQKIDVVTMAAPRFGLDDARLDLQPYPPPNRSGPLQGARSSDPKETAELAKVILQRLEAMGFRAGLRTADTLELALAAPSEADAVLVVRAVPVEPLFVLEDAAGAQVIDPSLSEVNLQIQPGVGIARRVRGRIYIGQAFLYARPSGVRLWSVHIPDFPSDGFLHKDAAILEQGFVDARRGAPTLGDAHRGKARVAFIESLLEALPPPRTGSEVGLTALEAIDVAAEEREQSFFDANHISVEVGTGWSFESLESQVRLPDDTPLPTLSTGDLAPVGGFAGLELRLRWVLPGGTSFAAGAWFGSVPESTLERSVFRGGETPRSDDILGRQTLQGEALFGGAMGAGRLFVLDENFMFEPSLHLLLEEWSFRAAPAGAFEPGSHTRIGAEGRANLLWLPTSSPFMARLGGEAKAGFDTTGQLFLGVGLSAGVGLFF